MLLSENYRKEGKDFQEFLRINREIAEATKEISVKTGDLTYFSYCSINAAQQKGKACFFKWNYATIPLFLNMGQFTMEYFSLEQFDPDLFKEIISGTQFLCADRDRNYYLISKQAIGGFCKVAGACGDTTINQADMIRNMHLASALVNVDQRVTLVVRNIQGQFGKIFAVAGKNFTNISQDIIGKLIYMIYMREIPEIEHWEISQERTKVKLVFPNLSTSTDEFNPGFILETSDIGKSSWSFQAIYGCNKEGYIIFNEDALYHTKGTTEEMLETRALNILKDKKILEKIKKHLSTISMDLDMVIEETKHLDLSEKRRVEMQENIRSQNRVCNNALDGLHFILSAFPKGMEYSQYDKLRNSIMLWVRTTK